MLVVEVSIKYEQVKLQAMDVWERSLMQSSLNLVG